MKKLNESLLDAWIRLTTTINSEKFVSDMPYNEALICNLLYRNLRHNPEHMLTATDLCNQTGMFKSQMNRTLCSMEEKHFIIRKRSDLDKRSVYVIPDLEHSDIYKKQHEKVLVYVNSIIEELGTQKTLDTIELFTEISNASERIENDKNFN